MPRATKRRGSIGAKSSKRKGLRDRVVSVENLQPNTHNYLIYGDVATGKTRLWSTFPKPALALICSGNKRASELDSIEEENMEGIESVILDSPKEVLEAVEWQKEEGRFKTIVLDNVSSFYRDVLAQEVLELDGELPEKLHWGFATGDQWQEVNSKCIEYIKRLMNLDCETVIIGHERAFEPNEDSEIKIPTKISVSTGKAVATWLAGTCCYVLNTDKRRKEISVTKGGKTVKKLTDDYE